MELAFAAIEFVVASVTTGLFALLPFLLVLRFAAQLRLHSAIVYVACGLTVAITGDVGISLWLAARLPEGDPERLSFVEAFARYLTGLLCGGGLGGLSYWFLAGRRQ